MTDRELTAQYGADNPIDPTIVEIESADGDVAQNAFTPHGAVEDRFRDEAYQDIVAEAIDDDELVFLSRRC